MTFTVTSDGPTTLTLRGAAPGTVISAEPGTHTYVVK
jgi:hypothetical protein